MRILYDQAVYALRNKGNVAILQSALARLMEYWPDASHEVLTSAPHILRLYCPKARPINPYRSQNWAYDDGALDGLIRRWPRPILRSVFELRELGLHRWQGLTLGSAKQRIGSLLRSRPDRHNSGSVETPMAFEDVGHSFANATDIVFNFELLVATGGQYMSDVIRDEAFGVLDRLEAANQRGIPTVMVGQGIGPIKDPELRARAMAVLPDVDLILVREKVEAPQLLSSLGVNPSRVNMTGDDAVEMVYHARSTKLGADIGVGLRIAHYTEVQDAHLTTVSTVLQKSASRYSAKLISLPISHANHELDARIINRMLAGYANFQTARWSFDTPLEIIKKTGRCRLVVAGTFHTAVFALAQGIPAVGLVNSTQYMNKFVGLADQFGVGCEVVCLDDENLSEKLAWAIEHAWETAEEVKPQLLKAAERQISEGRAGYRKLFELVQSRRREKIGVNEDS